MPEPASRRPRQAPHPCDSPDEPRLSDWFALHGPGEPVDGPGWWLCADQLRQLPKWLDQVQVWLDDVAGRPVHASVAPTYLTGWYLDVLTRTGVGWLLADEIVPDLSPDALWFRRDVWPTASRIGPRFRCAADHPAAAHPDAVGCAGAELRPAVISAVREHAAVFFDAFEPGVRTSSRQRWGMVDDYLDVALAGSAPGAGDRRRSCCFAFRLDEALLCSRCPRRLPPIAR